MAIRGLKRLFRMPRFTRRHIEREIDDELAFHLAQREERLRALGMPADQAREEARRRFGDVATVRDECLREDTDDLRQERLRTFADETWGDIRLALRSLRRTPGFTIVTLATLILGISALTSVFSYYDAIVYAPLPYHDASRIVAITQDNARYYRYSVVSLDALDLLRRNAHSFEPLSAYEENYVTALFGREPVQIATLRVDSAFLPLFTLRPEAGRLLAPEEIAANATVTMISDQLWRTRFGGDPHVVGQTLIMDRKPFRIVGVLPPGFRFPQRTDAITPLRAVPDSGSSTRTTYVSVLGKLRPGVTRDEARSELAVLSGRLRSIDTKVYRNTHLLVRDQMLDRELTARQFIVSPALFFGGASFVLLIACVNVGNLFYVRAAERRRTMAIRASLGAGRARLIRQALVESLAISVAAAAGAAWLSVVLVRLWIHLTGNVAFPAWIHVHIDIRIFIFVSVITLLVTVIVGLAPAREGTRFDLVQSLKGGDGGASSRTTLRSHRQGLVVQLALSVALFVAAALFAQSYRQLAGTDLGYPAGRIATVWMQCDEARYRSGSADCLDFAEDAARQAATAPGVAETAVWGGFAKFRESPNASKAAAKANNANYDSPIIPDGDSTRALGRAAFATEDAVSDGYFHLLGLATRAGRTFGAADVNGAPLVTVISAHAAQRLWGRTDVVGHRVQFGPGSPAVTVIGVVDDVRELQASERGTTLGVSTAFYLSTRQALNYHPQIIARGPGDVFAVRKAVVNVIHNMDPALLIFPQATMTASADIDPTLTVMRIFGGLVVTFAATGLLLSIIGIYGVVAFGMTQRTRELGIRLALGGTTSDVVRLVMRQALRFVAAGLAIGLVMSLATSRVLQTFLFEARPLDPTVYGAVCLLFGAVAVLACYLPARRVARVDPLIALRAE